MLKITGINVWEDGIVIVLDGDSDSGVAVYRDVCWVNNIVVVTVVGG